MRTWLPWLSGIFFCAAAVTEALLAKSPPPGKPLDEALAREAYVFVIGHEPVMRALMNEDYPIDLWSRDDAFASGERTRVWDFMRQRNLSVQDTFRAADLGMRERWPLPEGTPPPRATVAPLRPRPQD